MSFTASSCPKLAQHVKSESETGTHDMDRMGYHVKEVAQQEPNVEESAGTSETGVQQSRTPLPPARICAEGPVWAMPRSLGIASAGALPSLRSQAQSQHQPRGRFRMHCCWVAQDNRDDECAC